MSDTGNTKEVWIYDLRSDMPLIIWRNPHHLVHLWLFTGRIIINMLCTIYVPVYSEVYLTMEIQQL